MRQKLKGFCDGFGADGDNVGCVTVESEKIGVQPGFNILDAHLQGEEDKE